MAAPEVKPAYAHLRELRLRLVWCTLILLTGSTLGYFIRTPIIQLLERPLGQKLFYTSPMGSFDFVMRICFLVGFLAAVPALVYHLLRFIEPALPRRLSRQLVFGVIAASFGLMMTGVAFGYYISLPAALHFFGQVGSSNLQAIITADQYMSFVLNYLAVFAAVFQLPLILLLINNRVTPLGPTQLKRYRKWVIVGSFVVALVSPSAPDPLSQVILALPIIVLYEISIGLLWLVNRRRRPLTPVLPAARVAAASIPAAAGRPRPSTLPPRQRPAIAISHTIDLRALELPDPPRPRPNVLDLRTLGTGT